MHHIFHILNGDALKDQFPSSITGQLIIMRECMVDGDVSGNSPEEIFSSRTRFMTKHYKDVTPAIYYQKTTPEFYKMRNIPKDAEVHLWFEHDLFCQVNLWFVLYYLDVCNIKPNTYLVFPNSDLQFGFWRNGL